MINYVSVIVPDIEMATGFYDALLAVLAYRQHAKFDQVVAYGKDSISFIAMLPMGNRDLSITSQIHIAFSASSIEQVNNFHRTGLIYDSKSKCEPDFREYPQGEVYTACICDPFGNELEAIYKI